jgi:SH3 domain protein
MALACLGVGAQAQQVLYVTDSLRLEARTGPSTEHRIVTMLPSGTQVPVLEESDGWTRVTLPDGEEGWMLSRFLMTEPSARRQLAKTTSDLRDTRERNQALDAELASLRATNAELQRSMATLQESGQALATELAELKRTAASAVAIRNENDQLKQRSQELQRISDESVQAYSVLRASRERDWFLAGAGVLLGGMVLGLIIPKIRWKRRRGWGEL